MTIRVVLDKVVTKEGGLSITSPVNLSIKKAWKYMPRQNVALPELPAFMNSWTALPVDFGISGLRALNYRVHIQLLVAKATVEDDRSADIATAFWEKMRDAFDADLTLGDTVTLAVLRGGDPTLVVIERAKESFIGLNAYLDVEIKQSFAFS